MVHEDSRGMGWDVVEGPSLDFESGRRHPWFWTESCTRREGRSRGIYPYLLIRRLVSVSHNRVP